MLALCTLLFLAWLSAEVVNGRTARYDDQIRAIVHQQSTPALTLSMRVFTTIGSPPVLWPLVAIAAALFWYAGWRGETLLLIVSMLGALALDAALKLAFHRPRPMPFFDLAVPYTYSYPSGHAMFALCFYGALAWLTIRHVRSRPGRVFIWGAAALFTILIGFSRIYLGVHYPSDVLAGYCVAFIWMSVVATGARLRARRS